MSKEYIASLVLILGSILKAFNIEIANDLLEAIIAGGIALFIAISRFGKGDITVLGAKKF